MSGYEELYDAICDELAEGADGGSLDTDHTVRLSIDMTADFLDRQLERLAKRQGNRRIYRLKVEYPEGKGPGDLILVEKTLTKFGGTVLTDRYERRLPRERAYLTRSAAVDRGRMYTEMGLLWTLEQSNPITWGTP